VNMGTDLTYNFVFKGKFDSFDWRSDLSVYNDHFDLKPIK